MQACIGHELQRHFKASVFVEVQGCVAVAQQGQMGCERLVLAGSGCLTVKPVLEPG